MKSKSLDLAKIGYLYLNNGKWGGKPILTPEWAAESTRMQIDIPEKTFSMRGAGWSERSTNYGYHWYVRTTTGHHSYFVEGAGGQFIYVVPDLDVVTVITTGWMGYSSKYFTIIDDYAVHSAPLR